MKRYIIGALLLLMASACGKMPINGDLDGRWQIMKIEYASGEEDMPERAYYSVAIWHERNGATLRRQRINIEASGSAIGLCPVGVQEVLIQFLSELNYLCLFNGALSHAAGSFLPSVSNDG